MVILRHEGGQSASGASEVWLRSPAPQRHSVLSRPISLLLACSHARCSLPSSQGELDLPRHPCAPGAPQVALPAPTERHAVLLQDQGGAQRTVISMHRMPFWLVDRTGAQHAVVMYVAN